MVSRKSFRHLSLEQWKQCLTTAFEILGDYDVEIGDEISGHLDSNGSETFKNITKEEDIEVYVEAIQATEQNARQLIL